MNFKDIKILQLYLWNKVNYDKFNEGMKLQFNDENYISLIWLDFKVDPIGWIIKRNDESLFNFFISQIEKTNYKG